MIKLAICAAKKKKCENSRHPRALGIFYLENHTELRNEIGLILFSIKFSFQPYIKVIKLAQKIFHNLRKNTADENRKFPIFGTRDRPSVEVFTSEILASLFFGDKSLYLAVIEYIELAFYWYAQNYDNVILSIRKLELKLAVNRNFYVLLFSIQRR